MATLQENVDPGRYQLYINGEWVAPRSGRYLESFDPTTGEPWYELSDAGAEDIDRAVTAARLSRVIIHREGPSPHEKPLASERLAW